MADALRRGGAAVRATFARVSVGNGIAHDVRGRLPHYADDWMQGANCGIRILAPAVYIFFCSAIPALAFGQQLAQYTDGIVTGVSVLVATALCGLVQAVVGGQPLLIVGVAEPIVLTYKYMYDFAKGRPDLGPALFLPWASWVLVWAALMILLLAVTGTCVYINQFTRFSGELFGGLIAVLFLQQAVKGMRAEFLPQDPVGDLSVPSSTGPGTLYVWRLVNGFWGLFLGFGLLLTSLALRRWRQMRFGPPWLRSFLADYGVPLMVVAWSALSYALHGAPAGIPRRVLIPNTWDSRSNWSVVTDMGKVSGRYIAAGLIPALIIAILFFFDHNVSSQMAQLPEFNLKKPPAYHYDFALLACMTLACGLLGIPPVNGVLPQAPMHTRSLITLREQNTLAALRRKRKSGTKVKTSVSQLELTVVESSDVSSRSVIDGQLDLTVVESRDIGVRSLTADEPWDAANGNGPVHTSSPAQQQSRPAQESTKPRFEHGSISSGRPVPHVTANGTTMNGHQGAAVGSTVASAALAGTLRDGCSRRQMSGSVPLNEGPQPPPAILTMPVAAHEQRVTGLLQSLLVGACLGITPAIKWIPTAVLWGYFAYMALESLPGSQFWDRILLVFTDPRIRASMKPTAQAPYINSVGFAVIGAFTTCQLLYMLGVYGITWAGVAGVIFPVPIMLLVPIRQFIMPLVFPRAALAMLDPMSGDKLGSTNAERRGGRRHECEGEQLPVSS